MSVKLNRRAYDFAKKLVADRRAVLDDRDAWSEHQPSTEAENRYLDEHGPDGYGRWHLGIDDAHGPRTKSRYKFPYGDFDKVHRCAVLSAEVRAAQNDYEDIQLAAAHLHGMLDALR
jgi:hypothetical protein